MNEIKKSTEHYNKIASLSPVRSPESRTSDPDTEPRGWFIEIRSNNMQ
jgi:hypothetical protein